MIETEKQQRWWFATHPEFSWRGTGQRRESGARENPAKEAFLRGMMKAGWTREKAEERWRVYKLNQDVARGVATAMAAAGAVTSARAIPTGAYRWAVGLGEAGAIGKSGGPGKWVEVARPCHGLEHQSKMAGQSVRQSGGKYYIHEYEVNGVKFDNYADGKLYDYKENYSHLFDKNNELYSWVKNPGQWRQQAINQVDAAKGVPVIWRVGESQIEAFKKAVGRVPGLSIVP